MTSRVAIFLMLASWAGSAAASDAPTPSISPAIISAGLGGRPFQQVAITTRDLPRAVGFYRDTLGLPLMFESNGMAFFDVAGVRLMIALDPARPQSKATSILYFDTPDLIGTVGRLRRLGVTLQGPVETVQRSAASSLRLQQFVDPDGNALAVIGLVASD